MMKFPLWIAKNKNKILVYDSNGLLLKLYDSTEINSQDVEKNIGICNRNKNIDSLKP
ncbi:hypothetical protein [Abyssisolibacter fermentans]|uniref:hypothetical protein n=1 Tax=Abyssisolibacter fermentans TaxID=1766203 RepID=UPI0012E3C5ED|nr:hypothetical protein [Abyssisolibacter fermentans]